MTDEQLHGLGCQPSPPDERDYPAAALFAARGIEPQAAPPDAYTVPGTQPPISNQGSTPQCVAYSTANLKSYEDRIDQGDFFAWDRGLFFGRIGGGPDGAYVRDAMDQLLKVGYPTNLGNEAVHKVAAYYRVRVSKLEIQQALIAFGPLVFAVNWANSWFRPLSGGVLPSPDTDAGGHAIYAIGYNATGIILVNSWGGTWGDHGRCVLPWAYLNRVWEVWKAVDQIVVTTSEVTVPSTVEAFTSMPPRIVDSRSGKGTKAAPLAPGESRFVLIAGQGGIPDNATMIFGNLTATAETAAGWLSVTPVTPSAEYSTVNFPVADDRANGFVCALVNKGIWIKNGTKGTAHFIIDVPAFGLPA